MSPRRLLPLGWKTVVSASCAVAGMVPVAAASHNAFLEAEALRLQAMLQPYRRRQRQFRGRVLRSLEEHRKIVERIEAGDAADEMRNPVVVQGDRFHDLIAAIRAAEA